MTVAKDRLIAEVLGAAKRSDDVEKASGGFSGTVLVLDSHTLKIVSSACRRTDLSDNGVLFIEQLDRPRQPFPDLDVIYFIQCTKHNIDLVVGDHKKNSSLYRYSHVFFCSGRVSDAFMDFLTSSREFVTRCKNLVEVNLDFVSFEPRVFTTDSPLAIRAIGNNEDILVKTHIESIASLLGSLKEKPVIRYMAPEISAAGSMSSQRIALGLRREIDDLAKTIPLKSNGTTLLILDRSVETSGLWIHDFFYQALALDILDGVEEAGVKWSLGLPAAVQDDQEQALSVVPAFEYKSKSGKGVEETKKVLLGEIDPIYVKHRHDHFAVALDHVRTQLSGLIAQNESARKAGDPLEILRAIPEYQDLVAKLSVHLKLSESLASAIDKLALKEVVNFEQELATGVDDDGKEISVGKIFTALAHLFKDSRVLGVEERLRLVVLYLTQVEGVTGELAKDLISTIGGLDGDFALAVEKFIGLGIHGLTDTFKGKGLPDGEIKVSQQVQLSRHSLKPLSRVPGTRTNKLKRNKQFAKNSKFVNSRFRSDLADIVEQVLGNSLDVQAFPVVGGTGSSHYVTALAGGPKSPDHQSAAAMWGQTAALQSGSDVMRQKIFVFVTGGVTLGECRDMAEIEAKYDVDIVLGGSTVLTAKRLVEILLRP